MKTAVRNGDISSLMALIDAGEDSNSIEDQTRLSCLMFACENLQPEVLVVLLAAGADPNYATPDGWTALHHAVDAECMRSTEQESLRTPGSSDHSLPPVPI